MKTFNEFIEQYKFRYEAQYPEPPKHTIEACITKWTVTTKKEPTYTDMEFIKNTSISKGKVKRLLEFFTTARHIQDWKAAESNEVLSSDCTWDYFIQKPRLYYKPTKNPIIQNFEFRKLAQAKHETFSTFCNRVEVAGHTCPFCKCVTVVLRNIRFVTK